MRVHALILHTDIMTLTQSECIDLMERHGIKPTANRILVAKALSEAACPLSLSELEEKIFTIDKSGIFRTLTLFHEQHLVHAIADGNGTRYELCRSHDDDHDDDLHVHFQCERCGQTFCLEEIPIPPVQLPEGYQPVSANLTVKGVCPKCKSSNP
jgi:Fe2+/Zn2+ uptake regulation proteins